MSDEKIKIEITCTQKVKYSQEISVTQKELEILKGCDLCDIDQDIDQEAWAILEREIDPRQIISASDKYEDFEIDEYETEEDNYPLSPST